MTTVVITSILDPVSGKLAREIRQTKPFASLEEEAFLNLARTADHLQHCLATLLKEYQLTPTQYNMLRILRGAGSEGLTCSAACDRMITPDPDVTRLLDRMENRGLIRRARSKADRRVVMATISAAGLRLAGEIDEPLQRLMRKRLGQLGPQRLAELIDTLESLRDTHRPQKENSE